MSFLFVASFKCALPLLLPLLLPLPLSPSLSLVRVLLDVVGTRCVVEHFPIGSGYLNGVGLGIDVTKPQNSAVLDFSFFTFALPFPLFCKTKYSAISGV